MESTETTTDPEVVQNHPEVAQSDISVSSAEKKDLNNDNNSNQTSNNPEAETESEPIKKSSSSDSTIKNNNGLQRSASSRKDSKSKKKKEKFAWTEKQAELLLDQYPRNLRFDAEDDNEQSEQPDKYPFRTRSQSSPIITRSEKDSSQRRHSILKSQSANVVLENQILNDSTNDQQPPDEPSSSSRTQSSPKGKLRRSTSSDSSGSHKQVLPSDEEKEEKNKKTKVQPTNVQLAFPLVIPKDNNESNTQTLALSIHNNQDNTDTESEDPNQINQPHENDASEPPTATEFSDDDDEDDSTSHKDSSDASITPKTARQILFANREQAENLMLDIVLAIRCCILGVSNQQQSLLYYNVDSEPLQSSPFIPEREPSYAFTSEKVYYISRIGDQKRFTVKDFAGRGFLELRHLFGVDTHSYLTSWSTVNLNHNESAGKSGSLFVISPDKKYLLKTISKDESKYLRSVIPQYYTHMKSNPDSLLCRIYGHHKILQKKRPPVYFIIMSNLLNTDTIIHEIFDLKGSKVGRNAKTQDSESSEDNSSHASPNISRSSMNSNTSNTEKSNNDLHSPSLTVYKDMDFIQKAKKFRIASDISEQLQKQIESDCGWLSQHQFMDYSLLVAIHKTLPDDHNQLPQKTPLPNNNNNNTLTNGVQAKPLRQIPAQIFFVERMFEQSTALHWGQSTLRKASGLLGKYTKTLGSSVTSMLGTNDDSKETKRNRSYSEASIPSLSPPIFSQESFGSSRNKFAKGIVSAHKSKDSREIYYFGIIDFLQKYDSKKKIAHVAKSFRYAKEDLSTVDPLFYASRFKEFIVSSIKVVEQKKSKQKDKKTKKTKSKKEDSTTNETNTKPKKEESNSNEFSKQKRKGPARSSSTSNIEKNHAQRKLVPKEL